MKWIELILSFECNCRCLVCPASLQPASAKMSSGEIDGWLEHGLSQGAEGVWFGGGEPTLHPDLIASIERARQLGYVIRKIQTNGLRFAYQPFTKRCLQAGANQFSMSIKGPDAKTHDGITQNPGSFVHLTRAVENLVAQSAKVEADILITKENLTGLAACIEFFAGLGIKRFYFWLFSLHGLDFEANKKHLPSFSEIRPRLEAAFETAARLQVEATSFHTPPCILSPEFQDRYVHSGSLDLAVITPGSQPFMAEDSPMEGGQFLTGCAKCIIRPNCLGLRKDYLDLFGPEEFKALS
ncbi:MAG: radical SAM protein [Deltaproteobacteria bacterium]|nr:radical SAM protein [Deltaproteobacteria bacterium]